MSAATIGLQPDQYRALLDRGPAMVWRTGPDGRRDYLNAIWLTFTGRTLAQELGDGWTEGVHPDDLGSLLASYLDEVVRHQPFEREYRLRRHDGVYRYVLERAAPYTDDAGTFCGFIGNGLDVDERHDVFAGAGDFFEMSLDNLCVVGFDGYFKRLSPSWTKTLGWTEAELLARPSTEFVHPEDRDATLAGRARIQEGLPLGGLVNRYVCKDGSYRWFEWRSIAHVDRALVYAAARDITAQKLAEERLQESQILQEKLQRQLIFADRMACVGTLAAGVAHEINNPLAYVTANISLILEELKAAGANPATLPSDLPQLVVDVQEGAERIRKIVRSLKTFSRAEEERRTVIDLRPLLDQSISMAYNEIRHRARLVKDFGPIPLVNADEARLAQVSINLLINAAQALPDGDCAAHEIRVATSTDAAGSAVIEVRDTGSGIPARLIDHVFDPFFSTKPVGIGTGLGLSVCHNIVTNMGGEISVASEEGRGSTFRIRLPAAPKVEREATATPMPPPPARARATVLVVDDEPAIGILLGRLLREHEVTALTRASSALELLHAGRRFDIIFSDLMMPEVSGMDFYEEIKRWFPDMADRVVFVSGGAFTPGANTFLDRVGNERIEKPFDVKVVREMVQRFGRSPADAGARFVAAQPSVATSSG